MKNDRNAVSWTIIESTTLNEIRDSTNVQELSHEKWPAWAQSNTKFKRILFYSRQSGKSLSTVSLPSGYVDLGELWTERIDPKDSPRIYNYNYYLIAETTTGELFQSSPKIPKNPEHHSSSPSTWFDKLGSPL